METLPSELLVVILVQVSKYSLASVPAIALVCKQWNIFCPTFRLRGGIQEYAEHAAQQNHLSLLRLYYSWKRWKPYNLNELLWAAAWGGSQRCIQQVKKWFPPGTRYN